MAHNIIEIEGVTGKTVEKITITNEWNFRMVTVRFSDQTAINFDIRPRIEIEPKLLDWKTGNDEVLRKYDVIYEHEH